MTLEFDRIWQDYGMGDLENSLHSLFPELHMDLDAVFLKVLTGNIFGALSDVFGGIYKEVIAEFISQKNTFLWIMALGIGTVFITQFIQVFSRHEAADMGFYFSYLLMSAVLLRCFDSAMKVAALALHSIVSFMQVFVPAYFLSVGLSAGSVTAQCGYEIVVFVIYLVEHVLTGLLLPCIQVYVLLVLLNGLTVPERMNLMMQGLEKLICSLQKVCFSVVAGLTTLQSMLTPSVDAAKANVLKKTLASIPGVGDVADGVTDMVLGSAVVIKNSFGVVLLLFLLLVSALPLIKILLTGFLLKTSAALLNIVGDKRIIHCTDRVGRASSLLFRTVALSVLMFMVCVSVAAFTTNRGF